MDPKLLNFESSQKVDVSEDHISITNDSGKNVILRFDEIDMILIETNDLCPWDTDVWWRIKGKSTLLSIPGGASGEDAMLKRFQQIPDFDNSKVIDAML